MALAWEELKDALRPIPNYEDLSLRWQEGFAYAFVREHYNLSMPALLDYTRRMLGEDSRGRYKEYLAALTGTIQALEAAGVDDLLELVDQLDTREQFEDFVHRSGMDPRELIGLLKYLVYWFIPMKKTLPELTRGEPELLEAIRCLRAVGIRCSLDLLEKGRAPEGRQEIATMSDLPQAAVDGLVHRADFARLPWASKATITNLTGAGYGSLEKLSSADLAQFSADMDRYCASVGKSMKHAIETENVWRIAQIVPKIVGGKTS